MPKRDSQFTAILVDDEPLANQQLRTMLGEYPEIKVVAECLSGQQAVRRIRSLKPDVVFLDIHMPEMNGFEVLRKLNTEKFPLLVFVTAFDQYAVKAFEANALDYLLKPYDHKRLRKTVRKILQSTDTGEKLFVRMMEVVNTLERTTRYMSRVAVKQKGEISFVDTNQILWIEANGDYVILHTLAGDHLVHGRLKQFEANLEPEVFVRIHRSVIVNAQFIKRLEPLFHREVSVLLTNGQKITMSRKYRSAAFEKLHVG